MKELSPKKWSKIYKEWIRWSVPNAFYFILSIDLKGMNQEEMDSALFGYWWCNRK